MDDKTQICTICKKRILSGSWHIDKDGTILYYCSSDYNCKSRIKGSE